MAYQVISDELATLIARGALVVSALVIIYLLYRLFERPICKLRKVKKEQVTVTKVHFNMRGRGTIEVEDENTKRKRTFVMPFDGCEVGDRGILSHQGRYGITFEKNGDTKKDQSDYYYHFKKKQE